MKFTWILTTAFLVFSSSVFAQVVQQNLKKELSSSSFVALTCETVKGDTLTGFGFPNPIDNATIIYAETQPTGEKTKTWKIVKPKYVVFYDDRPTTKLFKALAFPADDSASQVENQKPDSTVVDTFHTYNLRYMRFGTPNGLNQLVYQNEKLRIFRPLPFGSAAAPLHLIFVQFTDQPVFQSQTFYLNYFKEKAFKKSVKKFFKLCPDLISQVEAGKYYPNSIANLKAFADAYAQGCAGN